MAKWILLAVAAGAASGFLNVGAALGSISALLLSHLTLLPLFLSGLGIGVAGVAVSGGIGALVVAAVGGPYSGLIYAGVNAVPAVVLCRQALLSRQVGGNREWYPGGLLLCWLIAIAAALYALAFAYFQIFHDGLEAAVEAAMRQFMAAPEGPTNAAVEANLARNREMLLTAAPFVPGIAAAYYILTMVLNAALAQHLLRRSGRNLRPSIVFSELTLPQELIYVLGACALVAVVSGALSQIAYTLAFILTVAYFLLGLAVVHAFLGRRANRGAALFSFYVMFILVMTLFSPAGLALFGLGVIEQMIGLRRRFMRGADEEDE